MRDKSGDRPFGFHVFISHGTKKPPPSVGATVAAPGTVDAFAAELTAALERATDARRAHQFKFDYDWQDIWPGDSWRRRIGTLMDWADAAVILLTKRSVGRAWPVTEAAMLIPWKPFVVVEWEAGVWDVIQREAGNLTDLADNDWDQDPTNLRTGPAGLTERQIVRWTPDPKELLRSVAEGILRLPYWQSEQDDGWNRGVRLLATVLAQGFAGDGGKDELWQLINEHGNGAAAKMSDRDSVTTFARQLALACLVKNPDDITVTRPGAAPAEEKHRKGMLLSSFEDAVPFIQRATTRDNGWALGALAEIARFWPDPRAAARLRSEVEPAGTAAGVPVRPVVEFKAVSFTGARVRNWYIQRAYLELAFPPKFEDIPLSHLELAEETGSVAQTLVKLLEGTRKTLYFHVPLPDWNRLEEIIEIIENHPWQATPGAATKVRTFVFSVENGGGSVPENPRGNYTRVAPVLSADDERLTEEDFMDALENFWSGDGGPSSVGYPGTLVPTGRSIG